MEYQKDHQVVGEDCAKISLTYEYDLVTAGYNQATARYYDYPDFPYFPLTTKYTVNMITIFYGEDILFSTHMFLQRYGRAGLERLSTRYEQKYKRILELWQLGREMDAEAEEEKE